MQLLRDRRRVSRLRSPHRLRLPLPSRASRPRASAHRAALQVPRCKRARHGFHLRNESRKIPMLVEVQVRVA
ncbi:hypothetical protein WMF04_22440 [Sorangium sp. So ce260]|uniref:hypothetical protein n=1 Tax=Sorangium sp. So ce260 TaxID=3133291 RepID=UPI003F5DFEB9